MLAFCGDNISMIVWGLLAILAITGLVLMLINNKKRKSQAVVDTHDDLVILHQLRRGPAAPSVSPFPLKLETYLRITGIQYKSDFSSPFSSKGKTPWIEHHGVPVEDSQFCMEYLNHKYKVDLNKHLTDEKKSVARAVQKMIEENLYWCLCAFTFGPDFGCLKDLLPYNWVKKTLVSNVLFWTIRLELWGQGIGRHSIDEIKHIGRGDLAAISTLLGDKPFLMGDVVSEVDCALFGLLAQLKWHTPNSYLAQTCRDDFPNLFEFCERMKNAFWPDWEQNIAN